MLTLDSVSWWSQHYFLSYYQYRWFPCRHGCEDHLWIPVSVWCWESEAQRHDVVLIFGRFLSPLSELSYRRNCAHSASYRHSADTPWCYRNGLNASSLNVLIFYMCLCMCGCRHGFILLLHMCRFSLVCRCMDVSVIVPLAAWSLWLHGLRTDTTICQERVKKKKSWQDGERACSGQPARPLLGNSL